MNQERIAAVRRKRQGTVARRFVSGFTLIELLLVMVILAILAAVVVPKFANRNEDAKKSAALQDITNMKAQVNVFEVDTGSFPTSLDQLTENTGNIPNWHGPYIDKLRQDPWGHDYIYHPPTGDSTDFQIISAGKDGQEGTADDVPSPEKK
jgi:general secretion pathway protein G